MKKSIEIEELRISSNGLHLEFIINCPDDYEFTEFSIQVGDEDDEYSIADSLFYEYVNTNEGNPEKKYIHPEDNRFIGQVPVELFGVTGPEIYRIHLEAKHIKDHEDSEHFEEVLNEVIVDIDHNIIPETIYADAYISDVSHAYECIMDDILAFNERCTNTEAQDRAIKNYLILYAHQEALRLGYIDEATKWFRMIQNCFGQCGSSNRKGKTSCSCGCSKSQVTVMDKHKNSCGCGR